MPVSRNERGFPTGGERGCGYARRQARPLQASYGESPGHGEDCQRPVNKPLRRLGNGGSFMNLCHRPDHKRQELTNAGAIAIAACVDYGPVSPTSNAATQKPGSPTMQVVAAPASAKSYIIDFTGNNLPVNLAAQVAKAGG